MPIDELLRSLTCEEYERAPFLTPLTIKEAFKKGREDLALIRGRKPRGRF